MRRGDFVFFKILIIWGKGIAKNVLDFAGFRIWTVPGDLRKFHPPSGAKNDLTVDETLGSEVSIALCSKFEVSAFGCRAAGEIPCLGDPHIL